MIIRNILLFFVLVFVQFISLGQEVGDRGCDESKVYRVKHILLEMSSWGNYHIVETVPRLDGDIDSLQNLIRASLSSIKELEKIYLKYPFKFVVQCDGKVTDIESLARKRPDIADSMLVVFRNMPRWIPGIVQDRPVKTIVLFMVVLSGGNINIEIPANENGSRLPRKNTSFSGTWIQYRKDSGTTDTLRFTGSTYYTNYIRQGEETRISAKIIEHDLDSGYVKLKYRNVYKNSSEIQPNSEFFYLVYASTQETMYTSQNDSSYPNKNFLEFNATCNVWKKQE
jgi:hypothetical protein